MHHRSGLWLVLALLSLVAATEQEESAMDAETAEKHLAFRKRVRPIIRDYIFTRYQQFRDSELTFRDIKEHIAQKVGMTYEDLKEDHLR